jgi:hypothetical protein
MLGAPGESSCRLPCRVGAGEIWNYATMRHGLCRIAIKYRGFVQVPLSTETYTLECHLAIKKKEKTKLTGLKQAS